MTVKQSMQHTILGIDRGSKYIGLAYMQKINGIIFPLGYLINDSGTYFNLSEILYKHHVKEIVIGRPSKQENIQEKITNFIKQLDSIISSKEITITTQEEDYSSVESGEILSHTAEQLKLQTDGNNYRKNAAQDTISAMVILERWKNNNPEL